VKTTTLILLAGWLLATASLTSHAQPDRTNPNPRPAPAPRVGETAPDFKLQTKDGGREVRLSSFKGQRPVVLVFGSFT
jgi:hypothetical protein